MARANVVIVVLFFGVAGALRASEDELRRALDQLSASYTESQRKLADREVAVRALTESLAIARTESELFKKLWTEAQVRVQTLGANITDADGIAQQSKLVETLRALYLGEVERQRLVLQIGRLIAAVESNREIAAEIAELKRLVAAGDKTVPLTGVGSIEVTKVLEVSPKLRLVVLDMGAQQGARIGMPMIVWRGDRGVAELRIVEVRQKISGALIEKVENDVTLQAGDTARVSQN